MENYLKFTTVMNELRKNFKSRDGTIELDSVRWTRFPCILVFLSVFVGRSEV